MQTPFTLLFGMPSASEWILIIVAFIILLTPVFLVIYFIKKNMNVKKDKEVIRKL